MNGYVFKMPLVSVINLSKVIIPTLSLFIILTTFGCKDKIKSGEIEPKKEKIVGVTTTTVTPTVINDTYEISGNIKSRQVGTISSRVVGEVKDVYVREGDVVKAGQLLLKIDDSDITQRLNAAEKAVESARFNRELTKKTYQRFKALADEKAVSGQELDQIETQMKVSEAEFERAKAMLNETVLQHKYTQITAPYNGIITAKHIEKGNIAAQGTPLFSIE
ncbi:MAG: efflux RND transporter periplasmic adaptor subunit, partial [Thermodesulfovibrionales bacterium]